MNDDVEVSVEQEDPEALTPLTRDQIRAQLIGTTPESKRVPLSIYGCDLELKQPDLKTILRARNQEDPAKRSADMIISYAVMPGTDIKVFEVGDLDMILRWPFGEDLVALNEAIAELTGINLDEVEEELDSNPLD